MSNPPVQPAPPKLARSVNPLAVISVDQPAQIAADIPDLAGNRRAGDRVFFVAPPGEIGPLYRAESSLRAGKRPMAPAIRGMIVGISCLPGFAIMVLGLLAGADSDGMVAGLIIGGAALLLGLALALYFTRFKVACAYVGQLGAVRYTLKGSFTKPPVVEQVNFRQAAELRTAQTRHYYNGVYTGTTYNFRWTDPAGRTVLTLSGKHNGKNGLPKPGDPFHFAAAAEITWSMFVLNRADQELAEHGCLRFTIDAKKAVIIGPGFIEFHFSGRQDRCEAADIKSIGLSGGNFSIQHRDAKWYSSKGKFSFPYGNMGNARVFLRALDRFLPPSTWAQK